MPEKRSKDNDIGARLMQHRRALYSYIYACVRDEHVAEDIVQDVAQIALTSIDSLRDVERFSNWLFGIARRRVLMEFRSRRREQIVPPDVVELLAVEAEATEPERLAQRKEFLMECVKELPDPMRDILRQRYDGSVLDVGEEGESHRTSGLWCFETTTHEAGGLRRRETRGGECMSDPNDNELLLAFLSDELPADQHEKLFARLRNEPELVRHMLDLSADEEMLREWATGLGHFDKPQNSEDDSTLAYEENAQAGQENIEASPTPITRRRRATGKRYALPAIAATILAVVSLAWWVSLPASIAHVEHVSNASGLSRSFGWRTLRVGESLRFESGVVELTTRRGVKVVAEGPFHCRFDSAQELTLIKGRLYADVPEAGRGFQVQTPDGEIVDWGTRFGIEVRADQVTEVHVFEGKVTAELANDAESAKSELQAGQAVAMSAKEDTVEEIPLRHKFAQQAAPYTEHFAYKRGAALAGQSGWFDSGLFSRSIFISGNTLDYPGLASGTTGCAEIKFHQGEMASPVGRRWHEEYVALVIQPDDDFAKRLSLEPATLISFGSLDGPANSHVCLVVRKSNPNDRQGSNYGLLVDGKSDFGVAADFRGFNPSLVIMRLGSEQVDLWVNPSSDTLGRRDAPDPDVSLRRSSGQTVEALWLNDAGNPQHTWYSIDSLRGGSTWAEVTPTE